jgi:type IV secretory pathway VirB10-like protein
MISSRDARKLFLAVAAAAFLTVAGCSNQATDQATNQAPQVPPKKSAAAKPAAKSAAAKPAASKTAAAKPAAKKPDSSKAVAAKTPAAKPAAKQVATSSKVTPASLVTVPKGTAISATVGQALASNKNHSGDTFAAVLASSIKVDGKIVIPKGTHVTGRVVTAKKGTPELTVALSSVDLNGKSYKLVSDPITRSAKAPAKSDASDADAAKAAPKKDVTLAAQTRLKFKLAKDVKLPVAVKS